VRYSSSDPSALWCRRGFIREPSHSTNLVWSTKIVVIKMMFVACSRLEKAFAAAGGPPKVLRMDNGPEMVSQALQRFCENKTGMVYIPPGCPWDNGYIESFNNRLCKECRNRNHWNTLFEPAWSSATSNRTQRPTPPLRAGLPDACRVRCGLQVHPHNGGLQHQLRMDQTNPTLEPGNGDSRGPVDRGVSGDLRFGVLAV
jgi:transposase InsO family protein